MSPRGITEVKRPLVVVLMSKQKEDRLPPNQRWIDRILRWNIDHPGIVPENPKVDLDSWKLIIDGEIEKPMTMTWKDLLALPAQDSVSDFHCVEGWSVKDCKWSGVKFKELAGIVKPLANAKHVFFTCADGYTTSLELTELIQDDVVLAYKLNDKLLDETIGAPLRLVVPSKYAYKSAMYVEKITFMKSKKLGYWEQLGYSDTADVWKNDRRGR